VDQQVECHNATTHCEIKKEYINRFYHSSQQPNYWPCKKDDRLIIFDHSYYFYRLIERVIQNNLNIFYYNNYLKSANQ
jgi:hypothetical protein